MQHTSGCHSFPLPNNDHGLFFKICLHYDLGTHTTSRLFHPPTTGWSFVLVALRSLVRSHQPALLLAWVVVPLA